MNPIAPTSSEVELQPRILGCGDGATIAYRQRAGKSPGIIFLGGFRSDMNGTKAAALDGFCRDRGQAFLRFDYFGQGASSGRFEEATIGRWKEDALSVIDGLTEGPQILVGSSIGGWIMLLAALARPARIAALIGIAAAPDATQDLIWDRLSSAERDRMQRDGAITVRSAYHPDGYELTYRFIEEGRAHLVLRRPLALAAPVRLIHGTADAEVPWQTGLRLAERLGGSDVTLTLVPGSDHRLATEVGLRRREG